MVVAVTAEKKVATVDRLSKLAAACFCANRIVGTPAISIKGLVGMMNGDKGLGTNRSQ